MTAPRICRSVALWPNFLLQFERHAKISWRVICTRECGFHRPISGYQVADHCTVSGSRSFTDTLCGAFGHVLTCFVLQLINLCLQLFLFAGMEVYVTYALM